MMNASPLPQPVVQRPQPPDPSCLPASDAPEDARMRAVRRYDILDTPPDGAYDRITALAARLFNVPIAIVSIVDADRIWFKSRVGLDAAQVARDPGLCASAILQNGPYVIADAASDARALANPLVAGELGLRFYAAVPLLTADGFNLGTLCIIDRQPRVLSDFDIANLRDLAALVMDQLELRLAAVRAMAELSGLPTDTVRDDTDVQSTHATAAAADTATFLNGAATAPEAASQPLTLLYVEDNPVNLMLIEDVIAHRPDVRLLSARDGKRGIEIARAARPDVILMDINLPGISGITTLRFLRADPRTAHIPVIALSANAAPRDVARGAAAGFFRYLTKPINVNEFLKTLDVALQFAQSNTPRTRSQNGA